MKTIDIQQLEKLTLLKKLENTTPLAQNVKGYKYDIGASEKGFVLTNGRTGNTKKPKNSKPFLISMWPLIFQSSFRKSFSKAFPQYASSDKGSVTLSGSINYDNIFFKQVETLTSVAQLPDILITTDINSIYHNSFRKKLLNGDNFEKLHISYHSIYNNIGFAHSPKLVGMFAADALVMVVNKSKLVNKPLPREWYELLNPSFYNSIVVCGDRDFFCNTFFYHYIKNYGLKAVEVLVQNVSARIHPEEMLNTIHTNNSATDLVYIMPFSYAKNIQNKIDYKIVWPDDGAMLIPIQMLVKKGSYEKYEDVINFLTGEVLGSELEKQGLLPTNSNISPQFPGSKLNWIGWDFIENSDLKDLKENIKKYLL
jgi:ABC-type Fe3+ transport system substrate-binding protein